MVLSLNSTELERLLEPYSTWKHLKTDTTYTVLGIAKCSTNGVDGEVSVVYFSHKYQELRYRKLDEFLDGRFLRLPKIS